MTDQDARPERDVYAVDRADRTGWGRGSWWRWVLLALVVWIARAFVLAGGNEGAGPLLAVIAGVLLAIGVIRAVMDWLVTNFSPRARRDDV